MWGGVTEEKAFDVYPVGRWYLAGDTEWQGDLT